MSKDWALDDLPEMIKSFTAVTQVTENSLQKRIDIMRFNRLQQLFNVTALLLGLYRRYNCRNGEKIKGDVIGCKVDIESAERFWIKDAQTLLVERVEKGEFVRFSPQYQDGIIVVGGCCTRWNEATCNKHEFILLPYNHQLSYLVALNNHKKSRHLRISSTIAIIRSKYWILKIGNIINKCIFYKRRRAKFALQVMSDLRD